MAALADIIEIVAPARAAPGSKVDITVKVKNLSTFPLSIMVAGALEYGVTPWPGIDFPNYWANVGPGETYSFAGSFVMPASAVNIHAYSYYYDIDVFGYWYWYFDDAEVKSVSVATQYDFAIGTPLSRATETNIVEIAAPSMAAAGSKVDIVARVKNQTSSAMGVMVGGALEYGIIPWPGIDFPNYWANVGPGEVYDFPGSFAMPDKDVTMHVYSYYYGADGFWHYDGEKTKTIVRSV